MCSARACRPPRLRKTGSRTAPPRAIVEVMIAFPRAADNDGFRFPPPRMLVREGAGRAKDRDLPIGGRAEWPARREKPDLCDIILAARR
jgi:hypothetical protein